MLFTPMLKASDDTTTLTAHDKAKLLASTFFSLSLIVDLSDIMSATYLTSIYFSSITAQEVTAAVKQISLNKISESDKISNQILINHLLTLILVLIKLYNFCLNLFYCSEHF